MEPERPIPGTPRPDLSGRAPDHVAQLAREAAEARRLYESYRSDRSGLDATWQGIVNARRARSEQNAEDSADALAILLQLVELQGSVLTQQSVLLSSAADALGALVSESRAAVPVATRRHRWILALMVLTLIAAVVGVVVTAAT